MAIKNVKLRQGDPTDEIIQKMFSFPQSGIDYVAKRYLVVALASGNTNAFAFAIECPEAVDCVITNAILDITLAGGSATSVLDVDVVASSTDTGDSILDGLDLDTTGTFDRHKDPGGSGGLPVKWDRNTTFGGTNSFVTGKILVANASNLVGKVIIEYVPLG